MQKPYNYDTEKIFKEILKHHPIVKDAFDKIANYSAISRNLRNALVTEKSKMGEK